MRIKRWYQISGKDHWRRLKRQREDPKSGLALKQETQSMDRTCYKENRSERSKWEERNYPDLTN